MISRRNVLGADHGREFGTKYLDGDLAVVAERHGRDTPSPFRRRRVPVPGDSARRVRQPGQRARSVIKHPSNFDVVDGQKLRRTGTRRQQPLCAMQIAVERFGLAGNRRGASLAWRCSGNGLELPGQARRTPRAPGSSATPVSTASRQSLDRLSWSRRKPSERAQQPHAPRHPLRGRDVVRIIGRLPGANKEPHPDAVLNSLRRRPPRRPVRQQSPRRLEDHATR